jgi:hypothetical protein
MPASCSTAVTKNGKHYGPPKPEFGWAVIEWTVIESFDRPRVTRKLTAVHRRVALPFVEFRSRQ